MIVQCDKSLHSKTIHPLINIGCLSDISNTFIETGFYRIILKDRSSCPDFGRLCCDYQDASVIFLSPEYSLSCLTSEDLSFYKKSIFLFAIYQQDKNMLFSIAINAIVFYFLYQLVFFVPPDVTQPIKPG